MNTSQRLRCTCPRFMSRTLRNRAPLMMLPNHILKSLLHDFLISLGAPRYLAIQKTIYSSSIRPPVIVLTGAGGQGKSQVAIEFCHRNANAYQGVFWVDSSSEASANRSYDKTLKSLNGEAAPVENHDPKSNVKDILRDWKKPWLWYLIITTARTTFRTCPHSFPGPMEQARVRYWSQAVTFRVQDLARAYHLMG